MEYKEASMKIALGLAAFALVLTSGAQARAADTIIDRDRHIELQRLAAPLAGGTAVEGDVIRVDADSYIIRDASGHDLRVYFDRSTVRDNIAVGDHVIARFDRPAVPYASNIVRRPGDAPLAAGPLPRPQTIEGEVLRINTDNYVIRDLSGREIRLHVDGTTQLDGNLTPGDKVVARVVAPPSNALPYAETLYKLNSAQILEGQVVAIEGNNYVVRDRNGSEHRVYTDGSTAGGTNVVIGDRVVIVRGTTPTAHADSITKR
jgi:uncharacterized protein YdeI (BOF family)